ncbi:Phosphoglycerate mutase [[Leptolyngbya] sp. PCC 7376]|uniref:histidine phosphatase family protein n=1 Tax=[Leptolyngbya] sp. PCC 7376 TaxID=111781 RepID=UPI00029F41F1|nr:histidine phosphatase family protein [[Leptolyngbya] sp. PCC 7376]AFY38757.1 Phosphoglycerate mutase [[Leptolyngbya] sp. PCC 7376]
MKSIKPVEMFLALGLAVTIGACGAPAPEVDESSEGGEAETTEEVKEDHSEHSEEEHAAHGGEGGEGGEGGAEYSEGEQANADFVDKLAGAELLSALKEGGHVIYFRHAQTEKDYADQADPNMSLDDCDTQRKLNDVGIKQAEDIGAAFTEKEIPVGDVISSDYCRAWQTAELAFGRYEKDSKLNFLPFEDYTDEQVEEMKANVTPLLTATPPSGQNTVIVGHDDIFESATGIYPAPQGIAYVLIPDGNGGFELVANMLPEDWAEL